MNSTRALLLFGDPAKNEAKHMVMYSPPDVIHALPRRIYCNKHIIPNLARAFALIAARKLSDKIITFDGCFNIRKKRGGQTLSLHSWGLAIDINAAHNQFGKPPTMDSRIVECFELAGFEWGGRWKKPDGMHFQIKDVIL